MYVENCVDCGHSSTDHVHKTVKTLTANCFHKEEWNTRCSCRKFSKP